VQPRPSKDGGIIKGMKIIDTDNFGGDYPVEHDIAVGIKDKQKAAVMCEALNARFSGAGASRFYRVEEDDYKNGIGFEP
jgi:hypothetical protein